MFQDFIVIITSLSGCCAFIYWYFTRTFDYWKKRNVAHDKPYIFVGTGIKSLLLKNHIGLLDTDIYNNYPNEKLIGAFVSRKPALIVKDPDLIKNVFVKDFNNFVDREITVKNDWELLTQQLFLERGDLWRGLRQKLTPTFTVGKMRNMFPLVTEVSEEFQSYLKGVITDSNICEITDLSTRFTIDIVGSCVFGIRMNALKEQNSPFRSIGRTTFEPTLNRVFAYAVGQVFPSLFKLFKMRVTTIEEENFFINLVKSVMISRDYKPSSRHDLIDQLIQLKMKGYIQRENNNNKEDAACSFKITDELLAAQAFLFFAAGYDTSSTTIALTIYELSKNQDIQIKLIEEIDKVLAKYDQKITFESLNDMPYLKMVIKETLRLHPPVLNLNRVCTNSCTISDTDVQVDEGVSITIPVYALHHDSKYYPEPEKFIPERFTAEAEIQRHPFVYIPFGEGPRACLGYRFAMIQVMMGVLSIMENYKVDVNEKTIQKLRISATSLTLSSKDGIYLTISRRK